MSLLKKVLNKNNVNIDDAIKLINLGANPNLKNDAGQALIHYLVSNNTGGFGYDRTVLLRTLVQNHNLDINLKNSEQLTPIQILRSKKVWHTNDAMELVDLGANPNDLDINGNPLIHSLVNFDKDTIKNHNITAITTLVNKYKVDINSKNKDELTPLQLLINRNTWFTNDALKLVALGANPNVANANGQPLIHCLATYDKTEIKTHNHWAIALLVTKYKADINAKNAQGQTALECLMNNPLGYEAEDAFLFIRLGANPNTVNAKGESLLHRLATDGQNNNTALIRELLDKYHADDTLLNHNNETALDISLKTMMLSHHSANTYELIRHSAGFNRQVSELINSEQRNVSSLNRIISLAHANNDSKSYVLQGTIRDKAFDAFKKSIINRSPAEQLEQFEWAKTQPLFSQHRSHFFLARIGRTNTVSMIDKMIEHIKSTNPELTTPAVRS